MNGQDRGAWFAGVALVERDDAMLSRFGRGVGIAMGHQGDPNDERAVSTRELICRAARIDDNGNYSAGLRP
jgi:hypothetical protein